MSNKSYPSKLKQMSNLFSAATSVAKDVVTGNEIFVPDNIKQDRMNICLSCEWYDQEQIRCKACGCFLEQKTSYTSQSCPHNKWGFYKTE
jgi:Family of unknown function (DUF6171)